LSLIRIFAAFILQEHLTTTLYAPKTALCAEDRRRFGVYMSSLIARLESVMFQQEQGIKIDPAAFSFFYESTRSALRQPGTQLWWRKARSLYKPNLQQLVDGMIS
jgi:hypothetical protein